VYRRVLDEDELVSLRHLERFLAGYDRYLVEPARLGLELPGFGVERFRDSYFGSTRAYSSLLVSKEFYRRFLAYETSSSINSTASSSQMSYDFVGPVHEIEGVCGWSETAASRYAASGDALPF
jgi:uncharacterized protein DUF5672